MVLEMEPFVGAQGRYLGLINQILTKPLYTIPFRIIYRESEVSTKASRGAAETNVL